MKKFTIKYNPLFLDIGKESPPNEKEKIFTQAWQQGKYADALKSFPDKWVWLGENMENELICDNPQIAGMGLALSERAFTVIHEAFPIETEFNHPLKIDGHKFVWFSPPTVEKSDVNSTSLNIFTVRPLYKTLYSEKFVRFWKSQNFTGHEFVEITQP